MRRWLLGFCFLTVLGYGGSFPVVWHIPAKTLPLPYCASDRVVETLASIPPPDIRARKAFRTPSLDTWKTWAQSSQEEGEARLPFLLRRYRVRLDEELIDGLRVYRLTPPNPDPLLKHYRMIYLHGGGYVFGAGKSALTEAIIIAQRVGIPVFAVDYRMPPEHPYPAAVDDVARVYRALTKRYGATSLIVGGSSSGGGLALALMHRLKKEKVPLPAALYLGSPWADLTKCGDTFYTNEGIDRKLVTYDGFLAAAAKLYAGQHSLKDPEISPLYGDFSGLPPTLLVTGTRDLFLSLTVRVHRKLKAAGIDADLNVYEGLSHIEYFAIPDAPESIDHYRTLCRFLKRRLR